MPASSTTAPRALPLTLRGVGRRFDRPVLHGVDLDVAAGEIVAVLGPSGCGKSTLLRQLGGLDQPDTGTVRIGDEPARHADQRCAVAFQEPRLLPWRTLRDNVALGLPKPSKQSAKTSTASRTSRTTTSPRLTKLERDARLTELLDLVHLGPAGARRPREVSGGMAQRASLARALARQPAVLLLDEPFGALDALTRLRMQDLLLDVHDALPTTVVLVTHDVDEALYLADRIVLLADLGQQPADQADPASADSTHADTAGGATSIQRIVTVPGARRRDRDAPELAVLRQELLEGLGVHRVPAGHTRAADHASLTGHATA
ncbi:ABC transporter ATP-binding protein [Frigoribacterium sp. VKM Ac-2530]|uniref:ABC transporter ATP-binding protein n=1 Tax=Frigoribacterium sp. VKM Ac-2530 TaxID=2783822 RepID=UPI00188D6D35|nr:ABC transporter ATP-binding protein [Frigoribacterium sp. VKM Ac-2530]MBF4577965.1 ABC transporter ATP-binding protein [Frigoribacterium sp. VKM Ac-2530]